MSPLTVAAIVPVYRPRVVLEALASIAAQTCAPTQLVIVDDGSTDETAERIATWIQTAGLPFDVRLIRQPNQGVAAARNRAVAEARGCDLLAFLDSDDFWPPDYLARAVRVFASNLRLVAASGDLLSANSRHRRQKLLSCRHLQGQVTDILLPGGQAYPSSTVVRARCFQDVGGFNQRYPVFEDHDLFLRLSLLGPWGYVEGAPVTRRCGPVDTAEQAAQLTQTLETVAYRELGLQLIRRFLHADGGGRVVSQKVRQQTLSQLWYQLGRARIGAGQHAAALPCFRNALRRNPFHRRAWQRLIATQLRLALGLANPPMISGRATLDAPPVPGPSSHPPAPVPRATPMRRPPRQVPQ